MWCGDVWFRVGRAGRFQGCTGLPGHDFNYRIHAGCDASGGPLHVAAASADARAAHRAVQTCASSVVRYPGPYLVAKYLSIAV